MKYEDKYIMELAKCAIFSKEPCLAIEHVDWNYIYNKAYEQNILGLLYCAIASLKDNNVPTFILEKWQSDMIVTVATMSRKYNEYVKMSNILKKNGIKSVGLKGCFIRNLYPVPETRTMGDFDIIVRKSDLNRITAIFKQHKYVIEKDLFGIVAKEEKGYWEIFTLLEEEFQQNSQEWTEKLFNNVVEVNGLLYPNETLFFIHLILHTGKHYIERGSGIRNLCDIALFIDKYKNKVDFEYARKVCEEQNFGKIYNYLINVTKQWFEVDISNIAYTSVNCDKFVEYSLINGIFGKMDNVLIRQVSLDEDENKRGLIRLFFPSAKTLENRYKYLKKYPYFLPLAWIQRILYGKFGKKVKFRSMFADINGAVEFSEIRLKWLDELGLKDRH